MSHRRYFGPNDADALVKAIGACRRACVAASSVAPIGGPIYRAANRLMEEIDLGSPATGGISGSSRTPRPDHAGR